VLVAVVCDGAGSVREGRAGADFVARALTDLLSETLHTDLGADAVAAAVPDRVETIRIHLADLAASRQLALEDFACTLVGCVTSHAGGCMFHIGDGFAIQQGVSGDTVLSRPENGEYADETYFVTDASWRDHLRVTPLPAPESGCIIGLMSDGTAPFAVNRERNGFFRPFIDPIAAFLRETAAAVGNDALQNLLESSRACEISPDDKTLLLAFAL
jgi:hypothetical protein